MRALSSLGIGLSLVTAFLLLALLAELYHLLWWKRRRPNREIEEEGDSGSPARELLYLFCWKKPSSLSSTALNPQQIDISTEPPADPQQKETMEAELMRLHSLAGPPRLLFTIKEETREDLESDGGRSRASSRGRSLSETPFMTPLSSPAFLTPPLTPNPLFDSDVGGGRAIKSSPPPKFKFLRDAEEKLALRLHKLNDCVPSTTTTRSLEEEEGSFITLIIGKNRESSQVNPLPLAAHGKLSSYLSSSES